MRFRATSLQILFVSICMYGNLFSQTVDVWAEDAHTWVGEQGYVRVLCATNVPLAGLRVPIKLESASLTIDSVVFSNLVPPDQFNVYSQLNNINRRGFVQVLPLISGSPPTFYAYNEEIFRIYYRVVPNAIESSVVVDTFYNRFFDAGHWLVDEIEASDGVGNRILPDFASGTIWIQKRTDVESDVNSVPSSFVLEQNFPNPFNPSTTIVFSIPRDGSVKLEILDILGRLVETIIDEKVTAGQHELVWGAENAPSGLYFYRLTHSGGSILRKMAIVK